MKYNREFDIDLAVGKLAEHNIRELLTAAAKTGSIKFEVKSDFIVSDTGRLFFEYQSRGQPSGLSITEAEWLVYCSRDCGMNVALFLRTGYLKPRLARLLVEGKARKVEGGDSDTSRGVLMDIHELFK